MALSLLVSWVSSLATSRKVSQVQLPSSQYSRGVLTPLLVNMVLLYQMHWAQEPMVYRA